MVGAASQSQSEPQQQPPAVATAATAAEEEALKRNTDCVYFLASPLTCKKGSECEYRHSDVARLNPRDCWFWLHGNCLNQKCGFRHPPLDGVLGTQTPTSFGHPLPQGLTVAAPTEQFPAASSKLGVPCIFFQKGHCLKGDWCPFLHAPSLNGNKLSLMTGIASAAEAATHKEAVVENSAQKKASSSNVVKPVKSFPQLKPAVEVEPIPLRNEFPLNKRIHHSGNMALHRHANIAPVTNENHVSSICVQQPHVLDESGSMSNKDTDEVSREPSPGFDVLVDDERRDSGYYPSEDKYIAAREHKARNEYDIVHASDYDNEVGNERYQDSLGYGSQDQYKSKLPWERSSSSARVSEGSSYHERRPYSRSDNFGQVDESDLRHQLVKHKKANGLRSVISHEHACERYAEDQCFQGTRRDEHNSLHENSLSSRLRGRIRLPRRSSSPNYRGDVFMGADHGRSPPRRANIPSHGRILDRIKPRVRETFNNGGKNAGVGLHLRRDIISYNSADFAAPKSLAELKNRKNAEPSGHHANDPQSLRKRKYFLPDDQHQNGSDLSFEGPKPLREILKRKRGETIGNIHSGDLPINEGISESNRQREGNEATDNKTITAIANDNELYKTETEESNPTPFNRGPQSVASNLAAEDGLILEDVEAEAYEQRDGEDDYEQRGEDYELYDGENGDAGGEYADEDDDDDDDFAKKMGVMYS